VLPSSKASKAAVTGIRAINLMGRVISFKIAASHPFVAAIRWFKNFGVPIDCNGIRPSMPRARPAKAGGTAHKSIL
jgi:hypothetical protein